MSKLVELSQRLKHFILKGIWQLEVKKLSYAKARAVRYTRIALLTGRNYSDHKTGMQSLALSYYSAMSLVPLLAIILSITSHMGLDEYMQNLIYENFQGKIDQDNLDSIMTAAHNIVSTAKSGLMGVISALSFIWIIVKLMGGVEESFNDIWNVNSSRSLIRRILYYVLILILSPLVIMILFSGTVIYMNLLQKVEIDVAAFTFAMKLVSWSLFFAVTVLVFSAMYALIPNQKVQYGMALRAAFFSGFIFTLMQFIYLETQLFVTGISKVYGALAAIPLFMIWLKKSWNVILLGAQLSYAFQNIETYNIEDENGKDFSVQSE